MSTLYRQYRPRRFADVEGQPHIIGTLQQAILKQRLAHAYLFYGPRGTGKTTTARLLATRLNCSEANNKTGEACLKCPSCLASLEGNNVDTIEIDAASNRGIDDIRALREATSSRPTLGLYKVYIIDEVHMLTNEAFAALLKTLEEPLKHIFFILATTELHKVPPTIASRCQIYRFRRATVFELKNRLTFLLKQEKREVEDSALDFIISRSDGCYRDAESLLGQVLTAYEGKITHQQLVDMLGLPAPHLINNFLTALIREEASPALEALDTSFAEGFDPEQFVRESIIVARNSALQLIKQESNSLSFTQEKDASVKLPVIIRTLIQALQDLAFVPQPLIALHLAVLTVCTKKGNVTIPVPATPKPQLAPTPIIKDEVLVGEVQVVRSAWPELIQKIKETNPVASTFLRAVEPVSLNEGKLIIRAHYVLHRNYFEKPENKKIVQNILADILKKEITVQLQLDEANNTGSSWASPTAQTDDDSLYETAKQVFQVDKKG